MKTIYYSIVRKCNLPGTFRVSLMMMVMLLGNLLRANAQIVITTPYPAAAQQLTRGGLDTSLLTVEVNFLSACTANTATITLSSGVQYIPGSVTKIAGAAGITIADLGGNANVPTFTIAGVAAAGSITFTIKRTAGCSVGSNGKDAITVTGSCGTVTENNVSVNAYNILSPALSLTAPVALTNAVVGQTATRTLSITNGETVVLILLIIM